MKPVRQSLRNRNRKEEENERIGKEVIYRSNFQ
jgi:hypothetical protein